MESNQATRVSGGKMTLAVVLALLGGALLPVATIFELLTLCPMVMLGTVLMAFLCGWAGWIPAAVLAVTTLLSSGWLFGVEYCGVMAAAVALPGGAIALGIARRQDFFDQMRQGIAASVLGMLGAVAVLYVAMGGSMIEKMMDLMRTVFNSTPDASLALVMRSVNAMLPAGSELTVESYRAQLMGMLDLLQNLYVLMLPATILTGAVATAVLSVLWGNWRMARRGLATTESFVGISQWYLPSRVTVGALAMWLIAFLLNATGSDVGASVMAVVNMLASLIFMIQGAASLDRRMLKSGMSTGRRKGFTIAIVILSLIIPIASIALVIYGVASALYGDHGAIRRLVNRHGRGGGIGPEDGSDDDDHDDSDGEF